MTDFGCRLIGVMPLYDEEKDSYWMIPGYFKMLEKYGLTPVMLPLTTDRNTLDGLLDLCDGFLFTGGQDVNPAVYGASPVKACGEPCDARDEMECYMLRMLAETDKPVLGICRGIQIMNACFGGTLYQDLPSEYDSLVEHHMSPPYNRSVHSVEIVSGSVLSDILGTDVIGVNSYHHQAVKTVADCFDICAISEDGLVEAISMKNKKFYLGLQWHPELSYDSNSYSNMIIKSFADEVG